MFPFLNNPSVRWMNIIMTYSAFGLGLAQIPFAINFFYSLVLGPKAGPNPWHANSLEWAATSPPPHYNFQTIPTVYHPAYEYSVPGMASDYLPQTVPRPPEAGPLDPVMA
jgi:cytochrome c oxidase subunit 1